MNKSFREMATRTVIAENKFIECVVADGLSSADAQKVANAYVHLGLLRFDSVDGQFYIKNGALFDIQIMKNAVTNFEAIMATKARKYGKR